MDAGVDAGPSARGDVGAPDAGSDADAGPARDAGGMEVDAGWPVLLGADTCGDAPEVTAGGTFLGTTASMQDDYGFGLGAGCPAGGTASGRDVAYRLSPTSTTQYRVTVRPLRAQFDPMLYVQGTCGAESCLAGTVRTGPGAPESLSFGVPGGQTVYLIVDGELTSSGPYELEVLAR